MKMKTALLAAASAALIVASPELGGVVAAAQPQAPPQERVTFAKGASSATIKGQLKGDETMDYVVRAGAGQTITVTLKPSNPSNHFNVLPPGSPDAAMYVAQTGETYTGVLPADGDYTVRVYLMRNAARRGAVSTFTLTVGVTGKALAPLPAKRDATVAGTHYHATAQIACVPMPFGDTAPKTCEAGVVRRDTDGTATIEVSLGAAGKRRILFVKGKPEVSDSMEKMTSSRQGDVTVVAFESGERHEIPDALISGG
jgi:hypothetical protein